MRASLTVSINRCLNDYFAIDSDTENESVVDWFPSNYGTTIDLQQHTNIPVIMTLKVMVSIPAGLKAVTEYRPLSLGS